MANPMVPPRFTNVHVEDVYLGSHVILGARTTVLPGSKVGEGACTGAGSLVKGNLAPWTLHAGVPATPIRERKRDCLILEAELLASTSAQQNAK